MKPSDIPNIITVFRFLLVPPLVLLLLNHRYGTALIVFGVAGFSDALDGFLAKRYGWASRVGAIMDPLADKLLLVSSFVTLGWLGWIPLWLVALVILRDIVIVIGAMIYHWYVAYLETTPPTLVSKLNTFAQIMLVLAVMFSQSIQTLPFLWLDVLLYSVLVTTIWSGLDYVWVWGRRAWSGRDK
ncbi:MAG: CDP-alcohol phosphatidyltransferase family protein [Gammaproteobacteria bacterium]|nr:CDP-alcohol phosphatidyltransferase family protein [Gammaproteobacteria bacterium]